MDMKNSKMYVYLGCAVLAVVLVITAIVVPMAGTEKESARNSRTNKESSVSDKKPEHGVSKGNVSKDNPVPTVSKDEQSERADDEIKTARKEAVTDTDHSEVSGKQAKEVSVTQYNFHGGSTLAWPVKGNVIINYDMEHMVYFPTLDEYRYSNAIAIAADIGTPVLAGAAGEVTKIEENTEHGLCVTMRIGPEYEITYGQLQDCKLKVGQSVKRQEEFAKVAKVSKQYTEEGDHLYLALKREKEYENPLSYLDFSE